ncbi:hypothetical protein [Bacillus sp. NPDC094106]|uniref:hypothetical protein n=1 Tax=Bacillus sp. NPDC094106 TaxID=3363949 RepID=UPI00381915A9
MVVAEFRTDEKIAQEQTDYFDGLCDYCCGRKEDTGRYTHPTDVYRENELL